MTTIYEPLYLEGQQLSEPAFLPLNLLCNSRMAWREFSILVDFYRRGDHKRQTFTGIFSPKFGLKSKATGKEFIEFANQQTDVDICIINPFPQIAYYSMNVWMQGEIAHPGLTDIAQRLLDASGIEWDLAATPRHNQSVLCYSNFWVGSDVFWEEYVGEVLIPIAEFLEREPNSPSAKEVMVGTQHTDNVSFLPFIVERLLSTFLSLNPRLKVAAFPCNAVRALEFCLTDVERSIVEYMMPIVEAADEAGYFSTDLRSMMLLFSGICHRHGTTYFANNIHPHSGRALKSPS